MIYNHAEYRHMVAEFHEAFDVSTDLTLWLELLKEESAECIQAVLLNDKTNGLKELADITYVAFGLLQVLEKSESATETDTDNVEESLHVAADIAKMVVDHFDFTPEQDFEAFKRVHASNMSKLGDDGKPVRRADGKILKGPNYREPELTDLV